MKKTIIFPLIALLLCFACNNDDDTAPPITQENTFSCKINGNLFVPEDRSSFPNTFKGIIALAYPNNSWFFQFQNSGTVMFLYIVNVVDTGSYTIYLSDGNGFFIEQKTSGCEIIIQPTDSEVSHYSISNNETVQVLELDIDTRIVLEFDEITLASVEDPNNTIKLTDGKLNINLETLE